MTTISTTPDNSGDHSGATARCTSSLEYDVTVEIVTPEEQREREREREREQKRAQRRERNELLQAHPELMTPEEAAHAQQKVERAAAIAEPQAERLRQRVEDALARAQHIRDGTPDHGASGDDSGAETQTVGVMTHQAPCIPDVSGMSLLDAALAYAAAGMYVLPTDPGDIKNPGSIVKGHWQDQSSRDPAQICQWWNENPKYGIALHCGKSGLIAFDLDIDSLDTIEADGRKDIADALRACPSVHLTRREGDRGHYLFLMPQDKQYGNSAGAFMRWGQVRGANGVIILAPTPHPDADTKGGHYHWKRAS